MKHLIFVTPLVLLLPIRGMSQDTPLSALFEPTQQGNPGSLMKGVLNSSASDQFVPLSGDERFRLYLIRAYGPGSILSSATVAGFEQWTNNPKEWKQGADGYRKRLASSYATHAIQGTIEYGASALLHEDNRYRPSLETGFGKRARHAMVSTFTASDDAGHRHLAYSRIGSAAATAFIWRTWQPQSTSGVRNAVASFGFALGAQMGGNLFHEFWPDLKRQLSKRK